MKVTNPASLAPPLTNVELQTLLKKTTETLTIGELKQLADAIKRTPGGEAESSLVGALLTTKEK